jgi:Tol biopolymer transport system component
LFQRGTKARFTILNEAFSSEKLSTTGLVFAAAISPDGNSVVLSTKQGAKSSLWLRQLPSANNVEIVPALDGRYFKIVFSPDGDTIYFSRGMDGAEDASIFSKCRYAAGSGKIVDSTQGWLSVSPDASNLSYVRCPYTDEESAPFGLLIPVTAETNEDWASRPRPYRIGENEISPDGKRVAFATGQSRNQAM